MVGPEQTTRKNLIVGGEHGKEKFGRATRKGEGGSARKKGSRSTGCEEGLGEGIFTLMQRTIALQCRANASDHARTVAERHQERVKD